MLSRKMILVNGYKEFEPFNELATASYQKCIYDKVGKKYYININEYNLPNGLGYDFELNFDLEKLAIKSTLFAFGDLTIKEVETFIEDLWIKLGGIYYEEF